MRKVNSSEYTAAERLSHLGGEGWGIWGGRKLTEAPKWVSNNVPWRQRQLPFLHSRFIFYFHTRIGIWVQPSEIKPGGSRLLVWSSTPAPQDHSVLLTLITNTPHSWRSKTFVIPKGMAVEAAFFAATEIQICPFTLVIPRAKAMFSWSRVL